MFLKNAFSSRKTMQNIPAMDFIHELSKEELKSIGAYCQNIIQETIIRNEKLV